MEVLIKLLLVHFASDFMLQWVAMLESKSRSKFLSPYLYLHGLIHAVLSLLLLWDWHWLGAIAVISISHVIVDGCKLTFTNPRNERLLFFFDQIVHVIIIVLVWAWVSGFSLDAISIDTALWLHLLMLFFVTFPASIMIQKFFLKWPLPPMAAESLTGIGASIGFIERILIYFAVVSQQWSLIGFLIAAKSLFRFGEFKKTEERQYAEYLFVGTLLSFFIAVVSGLAYVNLAPHL